MPEPLQPPIAVHDAVLSMSRTNRATVHGHLEDAPQQQGDRRQLYDGPAEAQNGNEPQADSAPTEPRTTVSRREDEQPDGERQVVLQVGAHTGIVAEARSGGETRTSAVGREGGVERSRRRIEGEGADELEGLGAPRRRSIPASSHSTEIGPS